MKTQEYLALIREKTGFNDYKIAKEFNINQSNLSKYNRGTACLSESHAFLFAAILEINPAQVIADTKLENAQDKQDVQKIAFWSHYADKYQTICPTMPSIAIGQINPIIGDLDGNANLIINQSIEAKTKGAKIIVFPELSLTGYPPEDLLLRNNFICEVIDKTNDIVSLLPSDIMVIFGSIDKVDGIIYNAAFVAFGHKIEHIYHKRCLPNYGVFDEKRYFGAGQSELLINFSGQKIAVMICEDIWQADIIEQNITIGASLLISINASPFTIGKNKQRLDYLSNKAKKYKTPILYVNCIGGQDELVFDGASFMLDEQGVLLHKSGKFIQNMSLIKDKNTSKDNDLETKVIYNALVLATKDYISKNGFTGAVLGLSGGIDSALTLAIAADAIGEKNIQVLMMPSPYTSNMSLIDAQSQANIMGISYNNISIVAMMKSFNLSLSPLFSGLEKDITEENIQARIRGTLLMAVSNKTNKILLATGNKSEYAVGYSTLYGDMNGGFAPIKDVYKTMVYKLADYRNSISQVIPERVIARAPSAELSPNQTDQDTLPSYDILDGILMAFIENRQNIDSIIKLGYEPKIVKKIVNMVVKNEHKRRQSAPGVKISHNAFGKERRYPITSKYLY